MAKVKYSEFVDALDAAAALDGTETVVVIQDGAPVETTTQDIADLAGGATITSGTITGTDPVDVSCFPIPTTGVYHIKASILFTCTAQGSGTTVVGDGQLTEFLYIAIANETVENYNDTGTPIGSSFDGVSVLATSVTDGQLQITFTPPTTADTDTVFAYKIIASGFSA